MWPGHPGPSSRIRANRAVRGRPRSPSGAVPHLLSAPCLFCPSAPPRDLRSSFSSVRSPSRTCQAALVSQHCCSPPLWSPHFHARSLKSSSWHKQRALMPTFTDQDSSLLRNPNFWLLSWKKKKTQNIWWYRACCLATFHAQGGREAAPATLLPPLDGRLLPIQCPCSPLHCRRSNHGGEK